MCQGDGLRHIVRALRRTFCQRCRKEPTPGVGGLIIIGLTIFCSPDVLTLLVKCLKNWGTCGHLVLPRHALRQVTTFLFAACGIWRIPSWGEIGIHQSDCQVTARRRRGSFSLYVAFVLTSFYGKAIDGAGLVLAFFVGSLSWWWPAL